MKKIMFIIFAIIMLAGSLTFAFINNFNKKQPEPGNHQSEKQSNTTTEKIAYQGENLSKSITSPNDAIDNTTDDMKVIASGPVKEVPWENEGTFKEALEQSNTHIMLAAFCTVLKDPLPGEEFNVHLAARMLAGTILKPQEIFSQNQTLGPYTKSRGYQEGPTYIGSKLTKTYGGGVCKIASTLYNVAVLSNQKIIQRHAHSMPVPYVPYGQDATVAYGAKDFKFKNISDSNILIWAMGIDNILYIAFYGNYTPPKIEWNHSIIETYKAPVIYRINPELSPSEEKIILEGMDGAVVKSWITIENEDGTSDIEQMGTSYYTPMPYIIEKAK